MATCGTSFQATSQTRVRASEARAARLEAALRRIAERPSGSFPPGAHLPSDRLQFFHEGYHDMLDEARAALEPGAESGRE